MRLADQDDLATRRAQEVLEELNTTVRLPVRLNNEQTRRLLQDPKSLLSEINEQIRSILTGITVTRLVAAFERRLEEGLSMKPSQYLQADWASISADMLQELDVLFEKNRDKLFGANGQISRDLDLILEKVGDQPLTENLAIQLLGYMSQGARMVFDQKSHRQVWQRTTRLRYVYLAAQSLSARDSAYITADVLDHLDGARDAMKEMWGSAEWNWIRQNETMFTEAFLTKVASASGKSAESLQIPLSDWSDEDKNIARKYLGENVINSIYRQLLLSVISELWVDYLTRVEALRVSITLEAYAQRDPLVQYKGRASELFSQLLVDIRAGAISRMFNYRPRVVTQSEEVQAAVPVPVAAVDAGQPAGDTGGKKKRHRH